VLLKTLPGIIEKVATEASGRPAIVGDCPEWTYGELWHSLNAMADQLRGSGVVAGRPVGVRAVKSPDTIVTILGAWRAGVPVVLVSTDLGAAAVDNLLAHTGSSHLITVGGSAAPGTVPQLRIVETGLPPAGTNQRLAGAPLILATSGSTGAPKAVPLNAGGIDRFFSWAAGQFGIAPSTSVLSYAPLNFDLSLLDVWTTLSAGGQVVLIAQDRATDARHLCDLLLRYPAQVVQAVPLLFRLLAEANGQFLDTRHVIVTGDALPPALLPRLPELFPNARMYNLYGCTETNDSVIHEITVFDPEPIPIGRPITGVRIALVDADGRDIDGPGSGELLVSTPFQADGYLDDTLTRSRFLTRDGQTYYRTGDIVRRDTTGLLHLEGRADFQVKVRGVRTNLHDIEHVLERHPEVVEAAVVALPDDAAGHRLHATLRTRSAAGVDTFQIRTHCATALPRTSIPSTFDIRTEALPRTSTGKVDRNVIRAQRLEERV
jgi:amino acid adenylation domain-containing protein